MNPFAPAGQFDVRAAFTNTGTQSICFVTFQVVTLRSASGALPVLLKSDGALIGGEGAFVPAEVAGASPNLDVGQQQSYGFTIGLPTVEPFTFFVNVLGEPHNGSCSP